MSSDHMNKVSKIPGLYITAIIVQFFNILGLIIWSIYNPSGIGFLFYFEMVFFIVAWILLLLRKKLGFFLYLGFICSVIIISFIYYNSGQGILIGTTILILLIYTYYFNILK